MNKTVFERHEDWRRLYPEKAKIVDDYVASRDMIDGMSWAGQEAKRKKGMNE